MEIAARDLMVHNTGGKPTFIRGDQSSFIDVTLSSRKVGRKIENWAVLDMENLSDHQYICFDINTKVAVKRTRQHVTVDWEAFRTIIEIRATDVTMDPEEATKLVERCYKDCVRSKTKSLKKYPFWWNSEIDNKCKEATRIRRTTQRKMTGYTDDEKMQARERLRTCKKELKNLIKNSKNQQWAELCEDLNDDIWGDGYKIVTGRLGIQSPAELSTTQKKEIARHLFPQTTKLKRNTRPIAVVTPFSVEELKAVLEKAKSKKAPGPDGVPMEAIKEVGKIAPSLLLSIYNQLIEK